MRNNNILFGSYLAGLFEGAGHICFSKKNSKKKHNARFCIIFAQKNEPLAKRLIEIIGYGFIRYKPKDKTCVLTVSSIKGLKKIIEFINGELRTPKYILLHNLIDWINNNHSANVTKLFFKKGNLQKDSWLSGFVEAEGNFSIRYSKLSLKDNASKRNISFTLTIEQIMFEPISKNSFFDILTEIAKFLNCNLKTRKQISTGNEYFNLTASSNKSIIIILTYFKSFPLYSSKYLDLRDWEKSAILYMILKKSKVPYTDTHIEQAFALIDFHKNNMNLKRKKRYFNWDHLHKINNLL